MEYFNIEEAPSRLTRLREKLQQFSRYNIDRVVCLKFNQKLANFSASEFVDNILLDGLAARKRIVGNDFRFAKNREGDYEYLSKISTQKNFEVFMTDPYIVDGERVSSTLIRDTLAKGEITTANHYLGRPYTISGRVVHGDRRGKKIGFPTINIELHRYWSPITGIFSGYIHGVDNRCERRKINKLLMHFWHPTGSSTNCSLWSHRPFFFRGYFRYFSFTHRI